MDLPSEKIHELPATTAARGRCGDKTSAFLRLDTNCDEHRRPAVPRAAHVANKTAVIRVNLLSFLFASDHVKTVVVANSETNYVKALVVFDPVGHSPSGMRAFAATERRHSARRMPMMLPGIGRHLIITFLIIALVITINVVVVLFVRTT